MQTTEIEPKNTNDSTITDEVDDFLRSQEKVGDVEDSPEIAVRALDIDGTIISSRTPEQQSALEVLISDLESRAEHLSAIKTEASGVDLDDILDPRLQEVASLMHEIELTDERAELARVDDEATHTEMLVRDSELSSRLEAVYKKIDRLSSLQPIGPSKQDLPSNSGILQKIHHTISRGYRDKMYTYALGAHEQRLAEQKTEQASIESEQAEIKSGLSGGSYRVKETAAYQEFRHNVDEIKEFSETRLAEIAEEAKVEKDPAKRARLQAEILLIAKEISQISEKITLTSGKFSSESHRGYDWIGSIETPDAKVLFGDISGGESVYHLEATSLVKNDLTTQAEDVVSEFATSLFGQQYKKFKKLHDNNDSKFATQTLYTDSSEVWDIDKLADLLKGPLNRPSEMFDSLLTDEELDRISSALGSMAGSTDQFGEDSPVNILKTIIERQKQAKSFLERLRSDSVVTHATSAKNALLILQDGHLRSEVGAKSNNPHSFGQEVANSTQGDIIENRTISFSVDGVEDQFLETYNPDGERIEERRGIIFARRTSDICQDTPWFLMENTQTKSNTNTLELQVIDENGVAVEDMDVFVDQEDFDYWIDQLYRLGYDAEWVETHVHPLDFKRDKHRQISSSIVDTSRPVEGLPQNAGTYKDVRRAIRPTFMSSERVRVNESAPEIVIPTKIFRL
ncbi:MAG: hypothetical protein WCK26_01640 [Candidatus Saccharibacteria bacterium]